MGKNITLQLIIILSFTVNAYGLDCPADSAYHTDLRTLLPNGSPNPTFNEVIATGLCGCIGFASVFCCFRIAIIGFTIGWARFHCPVAPLPF